jgi:hypothetical protein
VRFDHVATLLQAAGMAEARDAPLDLVDLAEESGELIEVVDERLRTLEDLGLLLDGREVGVGVPPLLLRAGRQYLRARGGVRPEVLAFAPRVIDDLHAREALLEASAVLVDDFGDAIAEGNAVAFAISVVPPEARAAMTPRLAVALYGAAVALIARLVDGEPAACVAEEVLAVALLNEARSWLYEADLDTTERAAALEALPSLFSLFEDSDALGGDVDPDIATWFHPFHGRPAAGHLGA